MMIFEYLSRCVSSYYFCFSFNFKINQTITISD